MKIVNEMMKNWSCKDCYKVLNIMKRLVLSESRFMEISKIFSKELLLLGMRYYLS